MTPGTKSSELKLATAAGGLGILPVLMEMIQGDGGLSERMLLVLVGCITLVAVVYNISRGMAKTEPRSGDATASAGGASSEFKLSAVLGGMGVLPVFVDMVKGTAEDGSGMLSDNVRIALMIGIASIVASFVLSRGMAKTEVRTAPPAA